MTAISRKFWSLCNVGAKESWPDPDVRREDEVTGEQYFTPRFDECITHRDNYALTRRVARAVYEELQVRYIYI